MLAYGGALRALSLQDPRNAMRAHALDAHHAKDAPNHGYGPFIYLVSTPGNVVLEAVVGDRAGDHLPLPRLPELSPLRPLGRLGMLELRQHVEDVVHELSFRGIVSPVV